MKDLHLDTHARMRQFYPKALETALASYRKISRKPESEYLDLKKQQEACKVAIAHIQLLLKMGQDLTKDSISQNQAAQDVEYDHTLELIAAAQREIELKTGV